MDETGADERRATAAETRRWLRALYGEPLVFFTQQRKVSVQQAARLAVQGTAMRRVRC